MGHAIGLLDFDIDMDKKKIQQKCDVYGDHNCALEERGWIMGLGLGSYVNFTNQVFDSYDEAADYLYTTTGNYRQTAVKYKVYPPTKETQSIRDLKRRIKEYHDRISELNKPHFHNVKSATVKCKCCGSSLSTTYCGKSYSNNCPVCKAELRPQSVLDKIKKYKSTLGELDKKLKTEIKKENAKQEKKVKLRWLVCCEVHH